jgi:hypothetical protein
MPAELAERLSDVPAANEEPNFADGEDLHDFVREELRGPLADLFSIRDQIRVLQRSDAFGSCLNYRKAVADVLSGVDAIEAQLRRLWEQS